MNSQNSAGALSVVEKAVQGYASGVMSRDEVQAKRAQSKADLQQLQYAEQTGSMQQQVDTLNQQNAALQNKMDKEETFSALRMYSADGNPRHLNRLFKENQRVSEMIGVTDVTTLDPYNPEDAAMIRESGGDPTNFMPVGEMEDDEARELAKNHRQRFVKSRLKDGTWKVTDMQNVYAGTGFTKTLNDEEIASQLAKAKLAKGNDTSLERNATAVAAAKDRISKARAANEEPSTRDLELVNFGTAETAGTKPGLADVGDNTAQELVKSFGDEDTFFDTDFSDRKNFTKAWPKVNKIMIAEGAKFESADRAAIHDIRTLIAMGEPGKELTADETGLIDSMLVGAKKYMTDNVGGVDATSAYAAFRNTVRHALYGAALTEAEITSFNQAFGTLGQKLGPVLAQFKTSLNQVKAKLDSIASLNNPYVSKVMLGADQTQLDKMIAAIDARIEMLDTSKPKERIPLKERIKQRMEERGAPR